MVDDDESTNFLHELILKKVDVTDKIRVATNGEKALDYLNNIDENNPKPNLIFLDLNMPRMNGWEFMEEYAKLDDKFKADMVVVLLTTSLNPADRQKGEEMEEIKKFLSKPLEKESISELIETYF